MNCIKKGAAVLLIAAFCLGGCASKDIEGDAKKIIELRCQSMALAKKGADKANMEKIRTLAAQAGNLQISIAGKYTGEDAVKFANALSKGISDCK
tara:strand:- start:329 stop:613 length:285 start_codon:yes stop_codon:yes gene_type:complete